jgi:hypothetical protein
MGTRCLTHVMDLKGEPIITLYRQSDGYQGGHGSELKEFLEIQIMTNGLSNYNQNLANGMSCLAAKLVSHFKTKPGKFYLHKGGSSDLGEDYTYTVYPSNDQDDTTLSLKVESYSDELFNGLVSDYTATDNYADD